MGFPLSGVVCYHGSYGALVQNHPENGGFIDFSTRIALWQNEKTEKTETVSGFCLVLLQIFPFSHKSNNDWFSVLDHSLTPESVFQRNQPSLQGGSKFDTRLMECAIADFKRG
ncbi:MAG: hypothetical protein ABID63_18935 [Pseudomonadota bacterium]